MKLNTENYWMVRIQVKLCNANVRWKSESFEKHQNVVRKIVIRFTLQNTKINDFKQKKNPIRIRLNKFDTEIFCKLCEYSWSAL